MCGRVVIPLVHRHLFLSVHRERAENSQGFTAREEILAVGTGILDAATNEWRPSGLNLNRIIPRCREL